MKISSQLWPDSSSSSAFRTSSSFVDFGFEPALLPTVKLLQRHQTKCGAETMRQQKTLFKDRLRGRRSRQSPEPQQYPRPSTTRPRAR